jgi:hypothetical protein
MAQFDGDQRRFGEIDQGGASRAGVGDGHVGRPLRSLDHLLDAFSSTICAGTQGRHLSADVDAHPAPRAAGPAHQRWDSRHTPRSARFRWVPIPRTAGLAVVASVGAGAIGVSEVQLASSAMAASSGDAPRIHPATHLGPQSGLMPESRISFS